MGKIRIKALDGQEEKNKKQKPAKKTAKAPELKGEKQVSSTGAISEASVEKKATKQQTSSAQASEEKSGKTQNTLKKNKKIAGKRHTQNTALVKKDTLYPMKDAVVLLKKFKPSAFDESVELHINVKEPKISGQTVLPHGTGKSLRIKLADEKLIQDIENGKIEFDVLIAQPTIMPKLAKVARILGPRGLMPNPKAGTITNNPDEVVKKLNSGQISFKTEAQAPIIHIAVGRLTFSEKQLLENVQTLLSSITKGKIAKITLKSTMSPAIPVDPSEFN